jgi:hypothetical protein
MPWRPTSSLLVHLIRLSRHPRGMRCHILERRIHHGAVGVLAILTGLVMVARDWADRPWFYDYP